MVRVCVRALYPDDLDTLQTERAIYHSLLTAKLHSMRMYVRVQAYERENERNYWTDL